MSVTEDGKVFLIEITTALSGTQKVESLLTSTKNAAQICATQLTRGADLFQQTNNKHTLVVLKSEMKIKTYTISRIADNFLHIAYTVSD